MLIDFIPKGSETAVAYFHQQLLKKKSGERIINSMNYVFPNIKDVWTEKLLVVAFNLATPGREELPGPSSLWYKQWKWSNWNT